MKKASILILALVMLFAMSGCGEKQELKSPETAQREVVSNFFDSLRAGNFQKANDCLTEPIDFGFDLSKVPEEGKLLFSKLSYTINGIKENESLDVDVTMIDVNSELTSFATKNIGLLKDRDVEGLKNALRQRLEADDIKMKTSNVNIKLEERNGEYKILRDDSLTNALVGNALELANKLGVLK